MLSKLYSFPGHFHDNIAACFIMMAALMTFSQELAAQDKTISKGNGNTPLKFGVISVENARSLIVTENFSSAIGVYAQLVLKDTTSVVMNSEYAYALALGGIYDASLARLDRIWLNRGESKDAAYFASQVYALMGLGDLADEFGNGQSAPAWLSSFAPQLLKKYGRQISASEDRTLLITMFKQANRLAAQEYCLQAIGRFGEITHMFPNEYLPFVGYSIALEKAGLYERATGATESAIRALEARKGDQETIQVLEQRLNSLKGSMASSGKSPGLTSPASYSGASGIPMLVYAGGLIGSSYTSINGKFGLFMSKASYATVDAGITAMSGSTSSNLGFTIYQRGKIMAGGMGLSASIANGSTTFFYKVSLGPSIMNKSGTASWDIFIDGQRSLSKNGVTTMGLSIGRSIYFGKRK